MKSLIIDDKQDNRYFLERIMQGAGCDVISAVNGKDALEKLRSEPIDFIISDILMPEMDGFQLLTNIKKDQDLKHIPFLFYTATYTDEKDRVLGLALGADEYLMKPLDPEEFLKIIQELISKCESGKFKPKQPKKEGSQDNYKLYSERLVQKLQSKMLDLEREVGRRKRVQDQNIKLSQSVDQSPVIVMIADNNGLIEYVNPKFEQVTGYKAVEVLGQNPRILSSGFQPKEFYTELWQTINSGNEWKGEFCNKKKTGELYWEEASIAPIVGEDGIISSYVAVKKDITPRKRLEEERGLALQEAHDANTVKDQFIANISHEIRTPLNSILGFSDLLKQRYSVVISEKDQHIFGFITVAGERLMHTVDSILNLSMLKAGTISIQKRELDLNIISKRVIINLNQQAKDKHLKLEFVTPEQPSLIFADENCIYQAVLNLVDNAIKYTFEGGVELKICNRGDQISLSIVDTGIGISDEYQKRIFDPYTQESEGFTKNYQGLGLGLAITMQYLKLNNIEIELESKKDLGTMFTLRFPKYIEN